MDTLQTKSIDRMWQDVKDFHRKFGLEYTGKPRVLEGELGKFRVDFMSEEHCEYVAHRDALLLTFAEDSGDDANTAFHLEHMLDALVDLTYVVLGTAVLHGFNFPEAWRRVHEANMAKRRAETADESKRGTTFDVIKPPGWEPPNHADLVEDHAHRNTSEG